MKKTFLIGALSALILVGCGGGVPVEKQVVGTWNGKAELPSDQKDNAKAKSEVEAMNKVLTLELREDKTYTMNMGVPITGTWSVSGQGVSLVTETIMGKSVEEMKKLAAQFGSAEDAEKMSKPVQGNLSADGKSLSIESPTPGSGTLVFTKP